MKKCLTELVCPREKIIVQHLGIDLSQIEFIPRKPETSGEICVLIAGSFVEKKGIPYAIESFGRVRQAISSVKTGINDYWRFYWCTERGKKRRKS